VRSYATSERRGKLNGLLTDFRNRDGLKKIAEPARTKIEDNLGSAAICIDDSSILRAMKSGT